MAAIAAFVSCILSVVAVVAKVMPREGEQGSQVAPQPAVAPAAQDADARPDAVVVLCKANNTGHVLNAVTGETIATFQTGVGPHEVVVSPDARVAVVSNYGHMQPGQSLTVVSLAGAETKVISTVDLGDFRRPHGLAFVDNDTVLATAEVNKSLLRVSLKDGKVERLSDTAQAGSHMVVHGTVAGARRAFTANVGSGTASVIDLESGKVLKQVACGQGAEGIDLSPDGARLWVANNKEASISVVDAADGKVLSTFATGQVPIRVKFTPDGSKVLVTAAFSGEVRVYNAAAKEGDGGTVEYELIKTIDLRGGDEPLPKHPQFGDSPIPMGIVVTPDNAKAYFTLVRSGEVVGVDLKDYSVVSRWKVCEGIDGIAHLPATQTMVR